ncbi:MAG: translation initiation factor 6 [Promethearchaeota archaeon CR_4]|nr:MAG: translation initiation factor 6 [Candidatus Lokiarchaeota archaeon CR_4]
MIIHKDFFGGAESVGVFISVTENYLLYPPIVKKASVEELSKAFGVPAISITIGNGRVVGAYVVGNKKGLLIPGIVLTEELDKLQKTLPDVNITVLNSKNNALGNLILCNDKGALISFKLQEFAETIQETLGVPVKVGKFAGTDLVGSSGLANNAGAVLHPLANDQDCENVSQVLSVPVDISTVNCGIPYLGACAAVNNYALVVGKDTTGPELQRLSELLAV